MYKNAGSSELVRDAANPQEDVDIEVIDAKVDPLLLLKGLSTKKTRKERVSGEWSVPPPPPFAGPLSDRSREQEHAEKYAIQFHLAIFHNGRSYHATRTLPVVRKLREDLMAELGGGRARRQRRATEKQGAPILPCLPDFLGCESDGMLQVGSEARGFSFLQARLRTAAPLMEQWLLDVLRLVPPSQSPALSQFLWEPVSQEVSSSKTEGKRKLIRLVSIDEEDLETDKSQLDCEYPDE